LAISVVVSHYKSNAECAEETASAGVRDRSLFCSLNTYAQPPLTRNASFTLQTWVLNIFEQLLQPAGSFIGHSLRLLCFSHISDKKSISCLL
jgi:hypothetical protein